MPITFEKQYDKLTDHETFLKHEDTKKETMTVTTQLRQRSGNKKLSRVGKHNNNNNFNHRNNASRGSQLINFH